MGDSDSDNFDDFPCGNGDYCSQCEATGENFKQVIDGEDEEEMEEETVGWACAGATAPLAVEVRGIGFGWGGMMPGAKTPTKAALHLVRGVPEPYTRVPAASVQRGA